MSGCSKARRLKTEAVVHSSVRSTGLHDDGRGIMVTDVFFFFQAEDGIRDIGVTGVQTCALPISGARFCFSCGAGLDLGEASGNELSERRIVTVLFGDLSDFTAWAEDLDPERVKAIDPEERRVGKECRSRWSPYH